MGLGSTENGVLNTTGGGGGGGGNVTVVSSVLPTGAATAAKQDTGNNSLASIDSKLTGPIAVTGSFTNDGTFATPARQDTGNSSLAQIDTNTDPFLVAGGGAYVRQDSTATIAKETGGNLATVKTNTDPLVNGSSGGYVRQDSTGTIAKETGGNLATVKTNTDTLVASGAGGYVRQDSTATIAKESGGNLATIAGVVDVKGDIIQDGAPVYSQSTSGSTPVTTSTSTDASTTPSSGNHIEVYRLHCTNSSATPVLVEWKENGGTTRYVSYLPQYGIMSLDLRGGWHLTTATKLVMVTTGTGSIYWNTDYRTVAD